MCVRDDVGAPVCMPLQRRADGVFIANSRAETRRDSLLRGTGTIHRFDVCELYMKVILVAHPI